MDKVKKLPLVELVSEKYQFSLKESELYIRSGNILVNSDRVILPFLKFKADAKIELINQKEYVSRGAYKLKKALEVFKVSPKDMTCLDIGSSTGGFVQILLINGAKKVYAVDVGTNQLDYSLRTNPKVVDYEKTNLKDLNLSFFDEQLDLIVTDVSFISLKHVFEVAKNILPEGKNLIALIKPQFEASSKYVSEGGYVEEKYHEFLINRVKNYALENSFEFIDIEKSPILGNKSKNIEYISIFRKV